MAQGLAEFESQLKSLGYEPIGGQAENRTAFAYAISGGRFDGTKITLGFEIPPNFPVTPPGGPHMSPHLLPMNPNAPGHPERTAESGFGQAWQYLSRPYPNGWKGRESVEIYLFHIEQLFKTL